MRAKPFFVSVSVVAIALASMAPAFGQVKVDPKLPDYKAVDEEMSGTINSVGSDTMNNLLSRWGEGFKKFYPKVKTEVIGKGSGTAMPALTEGTATFGPMSRDVSADEIAKFRKKFGYKPTALPTSLDMLAIYVNKDNPIADKGLTLKQVDGIFSKNQRAGGKDIRTWGDLGLNGEWASQPIQLNGRNSASGTYLYLKEHVLKKGDYKDSVKERPGSSAVVQAVADERYAIGYSGIGYKTAGVKAVPLGADKGKMIEATPKNTADYPLARYLFLCLNHDPKKPLDPLRREFIKFVFSKQGQEIVIDDGFLPVTVEEAAEALKSVGIK
jgi:phosphate transport system substrate-binding protein